MELAMCHVMKGQWGTFVLVSSEVPWKQIFEANKSLALEIQN